jgi:selenocysteine lyase/cysteine desulfurase
VTKESIGKGIDDVARVKETLDEAAGRVSTARRDFLKLFGYGTAGLAMGGLSVGPDGMPGLIGSAHAHSGKKGKGKKEKGKSPYAKAFDFERKLLYMNIGTTGASPTRVVDSYYEDYLDLSRNPTAYFFGQQEMRNAIAPGFGCDPYELVMSFNTTDGLWRVVMGIPFAPGDEIISTNMEEDAGISVLNMLVDRYGVEVKYVNLPTNDVYTDDEIMARFEAQRTDKTKAVLFSSPVYLTGARLPEKALCLWAADNGIISIVDGAHGPGMLALNLHDMGCDFYSGAGHKWQCGPGQTGFLYIRNNFDPADQLVQRPTSDYAPFIPPAYWDDTVDILIPGYSNTNELPTYYPTNTLIYGASGILKNGVRNPEHNIAAVLQLIGNGSRPSQNALAETCTMWDDWGREDIEEYIVSLAQYLRARIVDIWGPDSLSFPFTTDPDPVAQVGLTSFNPFSPGFDYNAALTAGDSMTQKATSAAAVAMLKDEYGIVVRNNSVPHTLRSDPTQNAGQGAFSSPLRISTHLFHSFKDVDRVIKALQAVVPTP